MKKHLTISVILSVFCYIIVSIQQQHLDISLYSNKASSALAFLIFAVNLCYYVIKYLDGEFTNVRF